MCDSKRKFHKSNLFSVPYIFTHKTLVNEHKGKILSFELLQAEQKLPHKKEWASEDYGTLRVIVKTIYGHWSQNTKNNRLNFCSQKILYRSNTIYYTCMPVIHNFNFKIKITNNILLNLLQLF